MSIRSDLALEVKRALEKAQGAGELPAFDMPDISIEEPRQQSHGDYATPAALEIARLARMAPIKIAEATAKHLEGLDYIRQVEVAPQETCTADYVIVMSIDGVNSDMLKSGVWAGRRLNNSPTKFGSS